MSDDQTGPSAPCGRGYRTRSERSANTTLGLPQSPATCFDDRPAVEAELDLFYRSALGSFASLNSLNETRSLRPHIGTRLRRDPTTAAGPDCQGQHNSDFIEGERTAEVLARDFLDSARDLISLKDTESRYLFVDRQFEKTFHARHVEIRGKKDEEMFAPEYPAAFRANDLQVLHACVAIEFQSVGAPSECG